jgi:hypothetical protein
MVTTFQKKKKKKDGDAISPRHSLSIGQTGVDLSRRTPFFNFFFFFFFFFLIINYFVLSLLDV